MARKIEWEIRRTGYGTFTVTAPTRMLALAAAEAQWLDETRWEREAGYEPAPIPDFTAHKVD